VCCCYFSSPEKKEKIVEVELVDIVFLNGPFLKPTFAYIVKININASFISIKEEESSWIVVG